LEQEHESARLRAMKLRLLFALIVVAAITLALAGWAVQGIGWALGGGSSARRARLATA
jgi:hypothetical protein